MGSQCILDVNDQIKKLALLYTTVDDNLTIDFYNLPFTILKTQESSVKNNLQVYVDKASNTVRWNEASSAYRVYSMTGSLIRQGSKGISSSYAGLPKGVYVLSIITSKGEKLIKRFILYLNYYGCNCRSFFLF